MNIDITSLKNKLSKYGITFENFQEQTGNLIGRVIVPNALRAYNRDLTIEQAFYLVANKVFESANVLAHGMPFRMIDVWERAVTLEDFRDFQKATYEEINQRFLSNAFPEFQFQGSVSLSNQNIQNGYIGGESITNWVNPQSRQIIANIDWEKYTDAANWVNDKYFMYRDMSNGWLPTSTKKRVLLALEDGSVGMQPKDEFASQKDLNTAKEQIDENSNRITSNKTDINEIKQQLLDYATKEELYDALGIFQKAEIWDPDKIYQKPAIVIHNGGFFWNLIDDNLGNVPGGITGIGKWVEVTKIIYEIKETNVVYEPATDIKYSLSNPNTNFYVDIQDVVNIEQLDENSLFDFLDKKFPNLNLSIEETNLFFNNLCNSNKDILHKNFGKKIKFAKDSIMFFDDAISLDEFWNKNNLNLSIAEKLDSNKYLKLANENTLNKTGGSNKLKHSDLPNIKYGFEVFWQNISDYGEQGKSVLNPEYENIEFHKINRNAPGHDGDKHDYIDGFSYDFSLNGNKEQTEINPEFYSIFAIRFLQDVFYEKDLNAYTNVCKMSIEGKLIKSTEEIELDDQDYIFIKKDKSTKNSFNSYILESRSGITLTVPDSVTLSAFLSKLDNTSDKADKGTFLDGVTKVEYDGSDPITWNSFVSGSVADYNENVLQVGLRWKELLTGKIIADRMIFRGYGIRDEDHAGDSRADFYTTKYINELEDNLKQQIDTQQQTYKEKLAEVEIKVNQNTDTNTLLKQDIDNLTIEQTNIKSELTNNYVSNAKLQESMNGVYTKTETSNLIDEKVKERQSINITTSESVIPWMTIQGKKVYCKYVSGSVTKGRWVKLANNVQDFIFNGVHNTTSANWDRYNVTGGMSVYTSSTDAYYKIYQDNKNQIWAYNSGLSETITFSGVIWYTKLN